MQNYCKNHVVILAIYTPLDTNHTHIFMIHDRKECVSQKS